MSVTYGLKNNLQVPFSLVLSVLRRIPRSVIALSRIGVSPHDTSREARSVILLNWFCILVLTSDVATMPQYVRMNLTTHTAFLSATMLCYLAVMGLNHLKVYHVARHVFYFVANLGIAFFSLTFGVETGVQMLFFVTPILVFLTYPRQARLARAVWIAVPVVALALTTIWRPSIEPYVTKVPFSPEELRIQWISAYSWTFLFIIGSARYFDHMAKIREKELAEALDRQWAAYGMVVHDVSAYLSNAQYAAFLLETGNLEHKQTQDVASLLGKDLDRLNQLVTILRDQLGRQPSLPSGKQEAFNLGEAFDEAINLLKIRRTMSIPCLFVASEAASCLMVSMKRDEMIQIIDNLADNASRAASRGNCKQLVFLMDVDPVESASDARVTLSFSDNGPGISPETMDKILSGESSGDEVPKARKSVGLKLISNYLEIFGARLHYQTPAAGPMVSRQKAEGAWGELPGTTILLDLPASMIANLSDERVAQSESRKKIA